MKNIIWPWCAVCDAPVDEARAVGPQRGDAVAVEGCCHGQTRTADMPVMQRPAAPPAADGGAPW